MQLVIRVDLEKAKQSLPEVFNLIGNCRWTDEVKEEAASGTVTLRQGSGSVPIGEWSVEEDAAERPGVPEASYRAVASARYARPKQIEVDRFATVSLAEDGAYVQGWLFVPRTDVASPADESSTVATPKPPRSVFPIDKGQRKAG